MTTTAKQLIEQLQLLKSDTEIAIVWYVADDIKDEFADYVEQEEGEYQLTDDETSEVLGRLFDTDSVWESINESMRYDFREILKEKQLTEVDVVDEQELWKE